MHTILLVDDSREQRSAFRRALRSHFNVVTASGGIEAIKVLREDPGISAVVSDLRMPVMGGIEFLSRAKSIAPLAGRIMLTGDPSQAATQKAINHCEVTRFLEKPCDKSQLIEAIQCTIERIADTPKGQIKRFDYKQRRPIVF